MDARFFGSPDIEVGITVRKFIMGKRIENKLEGRRNYDLWKGEATAILATQGHWKCFQGMETDSDKNFIAIQALNLTINPALYSYTNGCSTAKQAWEALEKAFTDSGIGRRVELLKQLVGLKQIDCESMEDYVHKIVSMAARVKQAGLDLGDAVVAALMLAGLPDKFHPMVMALENSVDKEKLTTDFVKNRLL